MWFTSLPRWLGSWGPRRRSLRDRRVALGQTAAPDPNRSRQRATKLTLPPETVPARTIEFGRNNQEQDAEEALQHRTDRHEAARPRWSWAGDSGPVGGEFVKNSRHRSMFMSARLISNSPPTASGAGRLCDEEGFVGSGV